MKNRLKELRKAKKLSQKEFAKAFNDFMKNNIRYAVLDNNFKIKNIRQTTISRWESGKTPIPKKYYRTLAFFFDVPLAYIQGARYSKKEIENIILNEVNLRLANRFIYGEMEDNQFSIENQLSIVLYDFLQIDKSNLKAYLNLCGKTVIEKQEVPILSEELAELLKKIYSFLFEDNSILSWDKKRVENKVELDAFLLTIAKLQLYEANLLRLTLVGDWFEYGKFLEDYDSKGLDEVERALKHAKISNKNMESNLHNSMLDDLKYSNDSTKILSSLKSYQYFIEYLISEVKSKMNILDAEYKKENKDQQ